MSKNKTGKRGLKIGKINSSHKGTLWYAVESGRERTTLTDSRIKLVLSDRLFKSHFVRWG